MKYIRNLQKADEKVLSVSPQIKKNTRKFVGIIVLINGRKYCVPLTSARKDGQIKSKFANRPNSLDFLRVLDTSRGSQNGCSPMIAALNFNNMIPVDESVLIKIDIKPLPTDPPEERRYKKIMAKELDWCQHNEDLIVNRANRLYDLATNTPDQIPRIMERCCDFLKLEAVLERYVARKAQKQQGEAYIESLSPEKVHYLRLSEKALQVLQQDGSIPMVVKKSEGEYLAKIALADKPNVDRLLDQAAQIVRKKKQ